MDQSVVVPPLTAQERRQVITIVADKDPALSDRVSAVFQQGEDPMTGLLRTMVVQQSASSERVLGEVASTRWWTLISIMIAMGLNAALVGVNMSLNWKGNTVEIVKPQPQHAPSPAPLVAPPGGLDFGG